MDKPCRIHRYSHELAGDKCSGVLALPTVKVPRGTTNVTAVTHVTTKRGKTVTAVTCPHCGQPVKQRSWAALKQAAYRARKSKQ